ncbi:3-deoxy-7-phosphoheptulonate synthase [Pelagicoccus sp. SDUM812005]|uniref:3-deoxy-7-phosphoheptulonate synthase n=1 Tax=Pelagicoccus sp. SDUM812005 TaxID=3041257 RepID=UPI00280FEBB9|nr:3-deoxy-7-phosphoheptulonate synthase [Pelagicoccus sp. SDUM812005]MDQ8182504.1 3-deoxy-7-phosphoheptulonate synthase [Pelagicoccus sp. SDUM812005]
MNATLLPEIQADTEAQPEADHGIELKPIPSPSKVRRDIPLSPAGQETVAKARREISAILSGEDAERLLVVCGPCSIDDVNAAHVYAERLRRLADTVSDKLLVVMRTYFEKPRSVVGWKGLLYDPLSGDESSPMAGINIARRFATRVNELGLPCATEFLNPLLALYLEDCMSYGSIGSRTVESQIHRELASRLPLPMGMKNGMDGTLSSAANGMLSARQAHSFFGQSLEGEVCLVETRGNRYTHLILRGGSSGTNFDEQSVAAAVEAGRQQGLARPVVVDCSHGNSQKDHRKQRLVIEEISRQLRQGQSGIAGVMLESYLTEGRQDVGRGETRRFGQSITDACIGWKDTEYLIQTLAETL